MTPDLIAALSTALVAVLAAVAKLIVTIRSRSTPPAA